METSCGLRVAMKSTTSNAITAPIVTAQRVGVPMESIALVVASGVSMGLLRLQRLKSPSR